MTPKFFHRWIKEWIKDSGIAGDWLMTKNVNLGRQLRNRWQSGAEM